MENFVVATQPGPLTEGFPVDGTISVLFSTGIDKRTLGASTFYLTTSSGVKVPAEIDYDPKRRTAVLKPTHPLVPGETYVAFVVGCSDENTFDGIVSVVGHALIGTYSWRFRTDASKAPDSPTPCLPADATLIRLQPELSWSAVDDADLYEVEISGSDSFFSTIWSTKTPETRATPSKTLSEGMYFWRVRARAKGLWSAYSPVFSFTLELSDAVKEPWPDEDGRSTGDLLVRQEPVGELVPIDASLLVFRIAAAASEIDLDSLKITGRSIFDDPSIHDHEDVEIASATIEPVDDAHSLLKIRL